MQASASPPETSAPGRRRSQPPATGNRTQRGRREHIAQPASLIERALSTWGPLVWRMAVTTIGSATEAQDVYQEVFLAFAVCPSSFESDEHIKAWLIRVTSNKCRDCLRSSWHRRVAPTDPSDLEAIAGSTSDDTDECALNQAVWNAVMQLSPKLREAVFLHYYANLSCEQIAAALHVSASSIRSRLQRARQRLQSILKEAWDQ